MTKAIYAALLLLIPLLSSGQGVADTAVYRFIELCDGSRAFPGKIYYKVNFLGHASFRTDSQVYRTGSIRHFQNSGGFFANTKNCTSSRAHFARRFKECNLSLYELPPPGQIRASYSAPDSARAHSIDYYSKNDGILKKPTLRNLKKDLSDNPESIKLLKQAKRLDIVSLGIFACGAALLTHGVLASSDSPTISPFVYIGIGATFASYVPYFNRYNRISRAIAEYNCDEQGKPCSDSRK